MVGLISTQTDRLNVLLLMLLELFQNEELTIRLEILLSTKVQEALNTMAELICLQRTSTLFTASLRLFRWPLCAC